MGQLRVLPQDKLSCRGVGVSSSPSAWAGSWLLRDAECITAFCHCRSDKYMALGPGDALRCWRSQALPRHGLTCTGLSCRCGLVLGSSFLQIPQFLRCACRAVAFAPVVICWGEAMRWALPIPPNAAGENPLTLSISLNTGETNPSGVSSLAWPSEPFMFPGAPERT